MLLVATGRCVLVRRLLTVFRTSECFLNRHVRHPACQHRGNRLPWYPVDVAADKFVKVKSPGCFGLEECHLVAARYRVLDIEVTFADGDVGIVHDYGVTL